MFFANFENYINYRNKVMENASQTNRFFSNSTTLEINDIYFIFDCSKEEALDLLNIINKIKSHYYIHSTITIFLIKQLKYKISLKNNFNNSKLSYKQFKIYLEYIANRKCYAPIDFYIYYILEEILESDNYINGLILENFMNIFIKKFENNRRKEHNLQLLLFFRNLMLATRIKISPDNYNLLLDTLFNKSDADFLEVVFKVLKDNIEVYPENLKEDLIYFINQFSTLYKTAESVSEKNEKTIEELDFKNLTVASFNNLPPFEHPIYIDEKYLGLCSLLFSESFINGKLTRNILSIAIEKLKWNPQVCFFFLNIVTSKAFAENKISNNLLEKVLNSKYLECITIILESEYYYNDTITEKDIHMLLDDNYKIILFIVEILLTDTKLDKNKEHTLLQGNDGNCYNYYHYMDLVAQLIKFENKLSLCYELEQAIGLYIEITPEPINIPLNNATNIFSLEIEPEVFQYYPTGNIFNPDTRRKAYLREWLCERKGIRELTRKLQSENPKERIRKNTN